MTCLPLSPRRHSKHYRDNGFFEFLREQLASFRIVFLLLGNHEPYHSNWDEAKSKLTRFKGEMACSFQTGKVRGEFVLLDQTRYDLSPTVTVLGCTLFSRINPEQAESISFGLNDFYYINDWSIESHRKAHSTDLQWLNMEVELISRLEPERKIIILTHHSPCIHEKAVDPKHANSRISSAFASDLSYQQCWNNKSVKIWVFGHTHFNCDFEDPQTGKGVVTNQRGYYFAQFAGFDSGKVIQM